MLMRILSALQPVLMKRRLPVILALVAIALVVPSLWSGWVMDDHFHRLKLTGSDRFPEIFDSSWDMFRFMDGDVERTRSVMDVGSIPCEWPRSMARVVSSRPAPTCLQPGRSRIVGCCWRLAREILVESGTSTIGSGASSWSIR